MPPNSNYYLEDFQTTEWEFLLKRIKKQERIYRNIWLLLMLGTVIVAFGGAWENIPIEGKRNEYVTIFSWNMYLIVLLSLMALFSSFVAITRYLELSKLYKDRKEKKKIVQKVLIKRKTFVPHNNSFHFYLNTPKKLSIEVNQQDFINYEEGDEISIEYSKNAEIYFGYF